MSCKNARTGARLLYMKIKFLGTGAAEGVPAMFCNCAFCNSVRAAGMSEVRTRSQVLIDDDILIDFPPEAYYHAFAMGVDLSSVAAVLVTHSHMDHFYAHDFILRGYKYAELSRNTFDIFGNAEVLRVFSECTRREMKPQVAPLIRLNEIKSFQEFFVADCRVIALPAEHTAAEDALLFYVERRGRGYLHLHDTGNLRGEAVEFLRKLGARADVVAYDCTFGARAGGLTARHMGLPDVLCVRSALENAGVIGRDAVNVLTHFSHNCRPYRADMDKLAADSGFVAAHDGLTITV